MGRKKIVDSTSTEIATNRIKDTTAGDVESDKVQPVLTYKQELEHLHKEMLRHGMRSVEELENKIVKL